MVGPSKILTVSYGTFSCTLEGFDEPFVMMKAVAEYFRDLAAEDRYFGAEPPVPDAEMLQRIAEREIHRRVEAKIGEHGVSLHQADTAPASIPEPLAQVPAAAVTVVAPQPAPAEAAPLRTAELMPEPVAEPAQPIPAPVAETVEEPVQPQETVALAIEAEAPAMDEAEAIVAGEAEAASDAYSPMDLSENEMAVLESAPAPAAPAPDSLPPAPPPMAASDTPAPDSIAAKLMRIRAVVEGVRASQAAHREIEESDVMPDLDASIPDDFGFALDTDADQPELVAAEAARAASRPHPADVGFDDEPAGLAEPDVSAPFSAGKGSAAPALYLEDEETEPSSLSDDAALLSRLSALREETQAAVAAVEKRIEPGPASPPPASAAPWAPPPGFEDDEMAADEAAAEPEPEPAGFFQRARARVIRIGRKIGHVEDPAEIARQAAAHEDAAMDDGSSDDGHEVERLMEEARQKLEGAETQRKFSSISHLKAAVAATIADRKMTRVESRGEMPPASEEDEIDRYRADLSRAVRPHRPTTVQPTADRPATERPASVAPLVLVSEQRVDRPAEAGRETSVRPRRISSSDPETGSDDDEYEFEVEEEISPDSFNSFAEFAEKLGAHNLTELLEAAAVYTASVEGRPYFTRPHILRKAEFVSSRNSAFNREDGLRSFGMLLREGKIMKISRGQFAVAEASRYMIETRRAAN